MSTNASSEFTYSSSTGTNWWDNVSGFAGGGEVHGPGTETSDSILARLSRGEFVINAAAVKRIGTNYLNRLNRGDVYHMRVTIPKFAKGGAVGNIGANAAARGMQSFAQDLGVNISPQINVNNYVDGQRIFDQYGKPLIRSEAKKEILENLNKKA